ncbi:hypothetical protein RFI_06057 [Reticulomyxa filosa]|uniref:Vacuolar sorting receptor thioredoxin-like domain-containing protein n=1 Tax=Reticulomyxa filosa TaxID=46433 RepID=X6NXN0_RETFI|nr:hypothetical protein RFI_06057 [Reticulomyxa filosa]|eukprot:ETO31065.1 hypothetical protein RFI_06057 [Reticulomyxa filosa]
MGLETTYGSILMNELGVVNWNPNNTNGTVYPLARELNWTIARLEWGLPHPDDRVEYELWTSANDLNSVAFKQNWRDTALNFEYNNYTVFTPHVYILDGAHWGCDDGGFHCGSQCTNSGRLFHYTFYFILFVCSLREVYIHMCVYYLTKFTITKKKNQQRRYCAPDPEYDLSVGLTGMSVVQENLRNICVWKLRMIILLFFFCIPFLYANSTKLNESLWWDYSNLWNKNCWLTNNSMITFTESCSYTQMTSLDSNMTQWVKNCVSTSGGYTYRGGVNTILQEEVRLRENQYLYNLPTVLVNSAIVYGNIDCDEITEQTCQVLDAICAGFINGTQPPQCFQTTTAAPAPNCSESDRDCQGVCYGHYSVDRCGLCLSSETDPHWDDCVGCDGVVNSGYKTNPCGICVSTSLATWNNTGKDCRGVCQGGYERDACGKCLSPSDPNYNSCNAATTTSSSKASTSFTLAILISVLIVVVIVAGIVVIAILYKKQKKTEKDIFTWTKQYQLMEDRSVNATKEKHEPAPAKESEEREEE